MPDGRADDLKLNCNKKYNLFSNFICN